MVVVRRCANPLKPKPEVLEFSAFAHTLYERFPLDGHDGFQYPSNGGDENGESPFGLRQETFQFGDGGHSLIAFVADCLVPTNIWGSSFSGHLCDGRWKGSDGKSPIFLFRFSEDRSFIVERSLGCADGLLKSRVDLRGVSKS
jgi:hypothetical protein